MNLKKISRISLALLMIFQLSVLPLNKQKACAAEDVSVMDVVDSTYELIRELEGFTCECMWDNTQWSIGYGTKCPFEHNCNGSYYHQKGGHVITEEEGMEIARDLMGYFVGIVRSKCTGLTLEQNQFDTLVSAAYNCGNLNNCPLVYYLQGTLTAEEARAQFLNWKIAAGSMYEQGLRNRREKEANFFFTGTIAGEDKCSDEYAGTYTTKNVTIYLSIRPEDDHSLVKDPIGRIYPNEIFTVTKANGSIAHVEYNGISGIVNMNYIQRVSEDAENAPESAPAEYKDSCSEEYAGTYTTKNVTEFLNIRSEAAHSLSSPSIGKIYPNETFTVTKASGNIAHVEYNGITGIVNKDYIQPVPESSPDVDENGCSVKYAGTYTTKNVTSYLNLRSETDYTLTGTPIGKIEPNEKFTVTKANSSIAYVNYNGQSGIVSMDYIQRVPEAPAVKQTDGDVNSDNVVDARDASAVLSDYSKMSAGQSSGFSESQQKAGDANKDGILDGRDATTILSFYAKQSVGSVQTISEYLASLDA